MNALRTAHLMAALLAASALSACDNGDCTPRGTPLVELGRGTGGVFEPFAEGQEVNLDVAPQGGFGVSIQARTEGIPTGAVKLKMDSVIDGELAGTWTIESIDLLCQAEDGTGLMWGAVVGLDQEKFKDNDALLALNGKRLTMVVTLTDELGDETIGETTVTVKVGG